jgi:UDP-glucose 4-epimerase
VGSHDQTQFVDTNVTGTLRYDFRHALRRLAAGADPHSSRALSIGAKGYHAASTGVYTVR